MVRRADVKVMRQGSSAVGRRNRAFAPQEGARVTMRGRKVAELGSAGSSAIWRCSTGRLHATVVAETPMELLVLGQRSSPP